MPDPTPDTAAPEWWPPRSGDVAAFYRPVDGNDPVRICVSYNYAERGWMNVQTGLLLPHDAQPYPGDLIMLLRDGVVYLGGSRSGPVATACAVYGPHEHVFRCQDCGEIRA